MLTLNPRMHAKGGLILGFQLMDAFNIHPCAAKNK